MDVVLITGSNSGIGKASAKLFSKEGYKVYATMRNLEKQGDLKECDCEILQLDVTDEDSINSAISTIIAKEGKIDILINNAGYGVFGPVETITDQQMHEQFEVNFFGALKVTQTVLPHMREQKSGHIINISSILGNKAVAGAGIYSATKFALEGISEALKQEVKNLGIKVSLVEPGPVNTEFMGSIQRPEIPQDYTDIIQEVDSNRAKRFENAQSPEDIANVILRVVKSDNPTFRNPTSESAKEWIGSVRKI